jgi:hypothetical protein
MSTVIDPKRSALDAIQQVHQLLKQGYTDVVDADLSKYFDTIPHQALMQCVSRRIVDRNVLRLIKLWLKTPVVHDDGKGRGGKITGGRKSTCGTPQGGVISPLLANVYMNRFLKYWRMQGCDEVFRAHVVSYADDFVILSRGKAAQALEWTAASNRAPGVAAERNQDRDTGWPERDLQLSGLHLWPDDVQERWNLLPWCKPIKDQRKSLEAEGRGTSSTQ